MYKAGIITCSDKGSEGLRVDESGIVIKELLESCDFKVYKYTILPDNGDKISDELIYMADILKINLILTAGGTGFSKRDVTPEATKGVIEREVPGITEAIRHCSLGITRRAMLSRAISGIRGNCLIINLPGSPKAARESLEYIMNAVVHGLDILTENDSECAQ